MSSLREGRYSRQILIPGIGEAGQARISSARVAVVGCGALGTVAADLLLRAGVRRLTLLDRDVVELSNLQRQSLFTEEDARERREKALAAAAALSAVDSAAKLKPLVADLSPTNAERLLSGHDLLVDATDSFAARFLLNDVAWKTRTPWVYGAAVGDEGAVGLFRPGETPCLRCYLELLPPPGSAPTCDTVGVLGPTTHLVASLEVSEAIKLLAGLPTMRGIALVSLWGASGPSVRNVLQGAAAWPACPTCALGSFPALAGEGAEHARTLCGRNSVQLVPEVSHDVDLESVAAALGGLGKVTRSSESLTADLGEIGITLFRDGRAIVRGTLDPARARGLYARYIGT